MKTKLMLTALIAATLVPAAAATAQNRELRRDRQDIRDEQRDVRQARRHGDRDDVRDERRDVREARQEYREDWRDYRNNHRDRYRGRRFVAPFRYNQFSVGVRIAPTYWGSQYRVNDVSRWNLPRAGRNLTFMFAITTTCTAREQLHWPCRSGVQQLLLVNSDEPALGNSVLARTGLPKAFGFVPHGAVMAPSARSITPDRIDSDISAADP